MLPTGARTWAAGCAYNGTNKLLQENWWALRASWDEKLQLGLFRACCGRAELPVCLLVSGLKALVAAGFLGVGYTHA